MANTYIDTNTLPHTKTPGGEFVEVLNNALCGAKNVVGTLRWLKTGESMTRPLTRRRTPAYLMEGEVTITSTAKIIRSPKETASTSD
jgi:hypothetical protein